MTFINTNEEVVVRELLARVVTPRKESHKGQNGKLLVIGGSELFHASFIWSAEIASKLVDMVHVSSPAEVNNEQMRNRLKERFWNGIVIPWEHVEDYVAEDDCILVGPGMVRAEGWMGEGDETKQIVDRLLKRFPKKKWVVDGGALQEVTPSLLTASMMITPHHREWERIKAKGVDGMKRGAEQETDCLIDFSTQHHGLTILLKGAVDTLVQQEEVVQIEGGNPGMTKGGTGDVLAGLIAALATTNDQWIAMQAGSVINKVAGDWLYESVGPYFNASDLLQKIPEVMHYFTK
jgi:NAD(P)H-hydrate epimerase